MKKLVIVVAALIAAFPSICADGQAQKRKPPRSPYAEQYKTLKKSLELDKDELSEMEAIEAVSVKFAGMFDRAADALARLAVRTEALEAENVQLKAQLDAAEKRIRDLESRADGFDGDLDKLFAWMNKTNDDLYNELSISQTAIGSKLTKLDSQVNNWYDGLSAQMDKVRSAVNTNTSNIRSLWAAVRQW